MPDLLFVVGPTAVGKSALAAEVAQQLNAEIVNADAFQIYQGLDILTGKPDLATRQQIRHHLLGSVPLSEAMSAARFRQMALGALAGIRARGKATLIVGGSGLYIQALTRGFDAPAPDLKKREELSRMPLAELVGCLSKLDPEMASRIDLKNPRRVLRAVEIASARAGCSRDVSRDSVQQNGFDSIEGVVLIRDRDDLHERINQRVHAMFREGVVEEVRAAAVIGPTAIQVLGLIEIRRFIAGEISRDDCILRIQQATRRYAKRQLTWFRGQSNFPRLNLTTLSHQEAIRAISQRFAPA